jgi:hypothetical protein
LLEAPPASAKNLVGEVRAGWVEAEEFVEEDLELVFSKSWLHEFDAVDVWQPRNVIEERWCRPAADSLVDLEGCSAAEFLGYQYDVVVMALWSLRVLLRRVIACGERHGLFFVLALAVSAKKAMRLIVQAPF